MTAIRRRVPLLDAGTVVAIFAMALYFARPLLEEWGLALYFRVHGVDSYVDLAGEFPLRPLQIAPSALQSALFGEGSLAFAVTFGLLLVAKYVALRWAVGPFLPARVAWLAACMGTVLIPWSAAWRGRFGPAELSAVFLFVALGAVLRSRGQGRVKWIVVAGVAIGLMLATYQALAVCAALLPVVALVGLPPPAVARNEAVRVWIRRVAIAWSPIALGAALYGVYCLLAVDAAGSAGYEGVIVDSTTSRLSLSGAWSSIPDLYRTAYNDAPWALPLFAGILALLVGGPISTLPGSRARIAWTAGLGAAIVLLPFTSLAYVASVAYLADADRVGFPIAVGFVLLTVTALLRFGDPGRFPAPAGDRAPGGPRDPRRRGRAPVVDAAAREGEPARLPGGGLPPVRDGHRRARRAREIRRRRGSHGDARRHLHALPVRLLERADAARHRRDRGNALHAGRRGQDRARGDRPRRELDAALRGCPAGETEAARPEGGRRARRPCAPAGDMRFTRG